MISILMLAVASFSNAARADVGWAASAPSAFDAKSISVPCKSGKIEGEFGYRVCSEVIPEIKSDLKKRVQMQVDHYYYGVDLDPGQAVQAEKDNRLAGVAYGAPLCNLVPGPFVKDQSEVSTNHKGASCGNYAGIFVHIEKKKKLGVVVDAKVTTIVDQRHDADMATREESYIRGAWIAALTCFHAQVAQEIESGKLQISEVNGQPGACAEAAREVADLGKESSVVAKRLEDKLKGVANLADIENCKKQDRSVASADKVGDSRQSACFLKASREAMAGAFKQVAVCETISRARRAWVTYFGDSTKIDQDIRAQIGEPCGRSCDQGEDSNSGSVTQCVNSCYQPRVTEWFRKRIEEYWPSDAKNGCRASATQISPLYAIGALGAFRRRRRRKTTKAGALALASVAALYVGCSGGGGGGGGYTMSSPPCSSMSQTEKDKAKADWMKQAQLAEKNKTPPPPNNPSLDLPAKECCENTPSGPKIKANAPKECGVLGAPGGDAEANALDQAAQGNASAMDSLAMAKSLESGNNAVVAGGNAGNGPASKGALATAGDPGQFAKFGSKDDSSGGPARANAPQATPSSAPSPGLTPGKRVLAGGGDPSSGNSNLSMNSGKTEAATAGAPVAIASPDAAGDLYASGGGRGPADSGSGSGEEMTLDGSASGHSIVDGMGAAEGGGAAAGEDFASMSGEDPADYFQKIGKTTSLFLIVEKRYKEKTLSWKREDTSRF